MATWKEGGSRSVMRQEVLQLKPSI
jgi:hypothetical protein